VWEENSLSRSEIVSDSLSLPFDFTPFSCILVPFILDPEGFPRLIIDQDTSLSHFNN